MATRQQRLSSTGRYGGLFRGARTAAERTHLLVVYIDDPPPMRFSQDYHAKYDPEAAGETIDTQQLYPSTPFFDYLAANGMQYTRATNTPVCSSGRASLQTGEYPTTHGVGTIVNTGREGDLSEFGDTGFDNGTPLATSLGSACTKAFIGKMHLSLDDGDSGLEYTIVDTAAESVAGRLGDWDTRAVWISNTQNAPLPDGITGAIRGGPLSDGNVANGASSLYSGVTGGHYFTRYRYNAQERNLGTRSLVGTGGQQDPSNTDGPYAQCVMTDHAIEFWQGLDHAGGERGFMLHTPQLTHSFYDLPPPATCPSLSKHWYTLNQSDFTQVPTWVRQQAMTEALDHEIHRMVKAMPQHVRDELTIIVTADNGIDGNYLDSLIEDGHDLGAHWTYMYDEARAKTTIFRYGLASQTIAFGPGIVAGTCDAIIEVAPDVHETVCAYFGATSGDGDGVSFINTWDGSETLATHDRTATQHSFHWPHGSPNPNDQALLANAAQWLVSTSYTEDDLVYNESFDKEPTIYQCLADHTSTAGDEPGQQPNSSWTTEWAAVSQRYVGYTYYTAGESGEAGGIYKLIRRHHDSGATNAATDLMYRTHDVNGAVVDEYEETPLDVTDAAYDATYAVLAAYVDVFEAS